MIFDEKHNIVCEEKTVISGRRSLIDRHSGGLEREVPWEKPVSQMFAASDTLECVCRSPPLHCSTSRSRATHARTHARTHALTHARTQSYNTAVHCVDLYADGSAALLMMNSVEHMRREGKDSLCRTATLGRV